MNLVLIGNLKEAKRMASRAVASGIPAIKQNPPWLDYSYQNSGTLTGTHPGFSWTHCHRFIGKNPDQIYHLDGYNGS